MGQSAEFFKTNISALEELGYKKDLYKIKAVEFNFKGTKPQLGQVANENDVEHFASNDKKQMEEYLLNEKGKTLILSVGNSYIIPEKVILKKNLIVVNRHSALLKPDLEARKFAHLDHVKMPPVRRGFFVPRHALYEYDDVTGITFHHVDAGIDTGDVIFQESALIPPGMNIDELLNMQGQLSKNSVGKVIEQILNGTSQRIEQEFKTGDKYHTQKHYPNGGVLNVGDGLDELYHYLRSFHIKNPAPWNKMLIHPLKLSDGEGLLGDIKNYSYLMGSNEKKGATFDKVAGIYRIVANEDSLEIML